MGRSKHADAQEGYIGEAASPAGSLQHIMMHDVSVASSKRKKNHSVTLFSMPMKARYPLDPGRISAAFWARRLASIQIMNSP